MQMWEKVAQSQQQLGNLPLFKQIRLVVPFNGSSAKNGERPGSC